MSSLVAKLEVVVRRHDEIQALLADHPEPGGGDYTRLTREYAEMNPIVEQMRGFQKLVSDLDDAVALAEAEDDAEMRAMAEDEARELRAEIEAKEQEMKVLLLPRDEADSRNAILEIRPGTGGDEAGLFAADLLGMYRRFAEMQGWKFETIEMTENDVGGLKEVSVRISGTNVFAALKFESGVHRVQRVPVTESGGRIHTSAATVAVLPEAEEVDIEIRAEDIRIDTMRASGAGGQHVNTTDSAVRITHLPTGIIVTQSQKSQHRNREEAMRVLRARLYEKARDEANAERAADRKGQVGSGDRSERIRTYNFPQGRVSDHRINLTLHKLDRIIAGDGLGEVIDALTAEDQAARLAELGE